MNDILPKSYVESSRKLQQMVGKFPGIVSTFPECKPLNGTPNRMEISKLYKS